MRPARAVILYLLFIFVGGAVLAPWVHRGLELVLSVEQASRVPFHRVVNRCLLSLALIGLVPFVRAMGLRSWREAGLGWPPDAGQWLRKGFAIGFTSLLLAAAASWLAGARVLEAHQGWSPLLKHLINAGLAALLVGLLEELLFRGAILGGLSRTLSFPSALLASSGIYAIVHFFERPEAPPQITWSSGFLVLGQMLRGFVEWEHLVPGFFALLAAGVILGLAWRRTGSLWFSIGLHAGWIFWLKSYGYLTREGAGANTWFWGTDRLIDGWVSLSGLALVAWWVWRLPAPVRSTAIVARPARYLSTLQ